MSYFQIYLEKNNRQSCIGQANASLENTRSKKWKIYSPFSQHAGWGELTKLKESKNEMVFELKSDYISKRFENHEQPSFQLEAGFLAEQIERMHQCVTETYEEVKRRQKKVLFTVKWDAKDRSID